MSVTPLVTIGITCYDAEPTIARAVDSALAQTWNAREIIVIDDGSADGSAAVVEEIARAHDDVRLIRHGGNRGVAEARKKLLLHSSGRVIYLFYDDDESVPDRLEHQYRLL